MTAKDLTTKAQMAKKLEVISGVLYIRSLRSAEKADRHGAAIYRMVRRWIEPGGEEELAKAAMDAREFLDQYAGDMGIKLEG